jgi:hypothetical protein
LCRVIAARDAPCVIHWNEETVMRRLFLPTLVSCLVATSVWADGALLQRLSTNVEAPSVVRPQGQNAVVGVLLQDLGGQAGRVTTFGQVFRAGDWPRGAGLVAEWNGRAVPIQTDVKARHADGSVRHAIISLVNPDASSAQISLRIGSAASAGAALPIESVLRRGYDLKLDLAVSGRRLSVDAAALLRQALGRGEKPWLSGPLATEIRVKEKLSHGWPDDGRSPHHPSPLCQLARDRLGRCRAV